MQIGIIGLGQSGKTTLFEALSNIENNNISIASVRVPDDRVTELSSIFNPKKITMAQVEFRDVGISLEQDGSFDSTTIQQIRESDALAVVLRNFKNDMVAHPYGSIDGVRDLKEIEDELFLTDLIQIENRLDRLNREGNTGRENEILSSMKECLEQGKPLSRIKLDNSGEKMIAGFRFLSKKPLLVVINSDENEEISLDPIISYCEERDYEYIKIYGKFEREIGKLNSEEQDEFFKEIGVEGSVVDRFINKCYSMLNLISFFTVGEDEVKAWTIQQGSTAVEAAEKIHSDIAKGFIRAEVVGCDEFLKAGSFKKLKENGKSRLEGKNYVVCDGEITHFRFNV
jgi:GTP-binding protein YchF